ncbi:MAG: 6-carboxytetrahydropterin synthase [Proteobacteria bacterium]|nr:6-carboxytetrahydropterin synthase [Pseudomonadota bacterium]
MFSLTVSDHMMIAHSFSGDIFGPAQRLHGATFVVEWELRRAELEAAGLVVDIGRMRAVLRGVLSRLEYRNLDEEPSLAGRNTTAEYLAFVVFERLREVVRSGGLGADVLSVLAGMKVTLRESPVAWAAYEGPIA